MKPELFSIGPLTFYSYGLMIALGVLAAIFVTERRAKTYGLNSEKIFGLGLSCALVGVVGAKLLFIITELPAILEEPSRLWDMLLSEGFVVYGGIIMGVLFAILYCRWNKMRFIQYFDLAMPSVALAQGFGRIGCFLAGCCYGRETDAWYGMTFSESMFAPSAAVIPTQLISSAANLINFLILVIFARNNKKAGRVGALYMINYSIGRFLIEFLRNDPRGNVGVLSTSQFISIFILILGIIIWCRAKEIPAENVTGNPSDNVEEASAKDVEESLE